MKLKKAFLTSAIAVTSASLISIVITSCSKSHIDDDQKIKLNDDGLFNDPISDQSFTYKDAVANALKRSSSWIKFKNALADEVVYKWYSDRAANDKHKDRNNEFKKNLKKWDYNANKDYKDIVKSCRSKYGANYKFYLQNEYLSAYGGTKESYIHAKIVEEAKKEFTRLLFDHNYFGIAVNTIDPTSKYPAIYTEINPAISENSLNNPINWGKIGFFAKTRVGFNPGDEASISEKIDYLAKNPDGDFAIMQNYIFDRWYETEKPFFSAAALFGYSNPTSSSSEKTLGDIYNKNLVSKLPDKPNEQFPFFGGVSIDSNDGDNKGYLAFWRWYWDLYHGNYETKWQNQSNGEEKWNGTISMPKSSTDDSQTLLLCSAKTMFNDLYTPYAIAAGTLYKWMVSDTVSPMNSMPQEDLEENVGDEGHRPEDKDDIRIFKNFFFIEGSATAPEENIPEGFDKNYILDLKNIYSTSNPDDPKYHCSLFNNNNSFTFFYGDNSTPGVRYVSNNFEVDLGKYDSTKDDYVNQQPWILEMNESGVHAQTIDGYYYATHDIQTNTKRDFSVDKFKDVFKYRLLQSLTYNQDKLISADLFGESGKLKKYFDDNYADLILNLATEKDGTGVYQNIFRNIDSYAKTEEFEDELLLKAVYTEEKFAGEDEYSLLVNYIKLTHEIDLAKNATETAESIDNKIYSYRSTQIANHTSQSGRKQYENGLCAPLVVKYENNQNFKTSRHYSEIINAIFADEIDNMGEAQLATKLQSLDDNTFINALINVGVNTSLAASPQIKAAKKVQSNRFWYHSNVIDKTMYEFMGNTTLANGIKIRTYSKYEEGFPQLNSIIGPGTGAIPYNNCVLSAYATSKLFSDSNNFASYTSLTSSTDFYSTMTNAFGNYFRNAKNAKGEFNDEILNFELFKSTIAYLAKPSTPDGDDYFANLYKYFDTKIQKNETAYVGYLRKFDLYDPQRSAYTKTLNQVEESVSTPYDWSADVGNIFDRDGYAGHGEGGQQSTSYAVDYSQYWHVAEKEFTGLSNDKTFAGFLGIQTKRQNDLDENSGIRSAAFDRFARSTFGSYDLSINDGSTQITQNKGALFPWAGNKDKDGQPYTFEDVTYPKTTDTITAEQVAAFSPDALKLAFSITEMDTKDDLMELAESLGDAIYGPSEYAKIASGDVVLDPSDVVQSLKYRMLEPLINDSGKGITPDYFTRLKDVELHDPTNKSKFYFEDDTRSGYRAMLTQINKSDVIEKTLTPTWNSGAWQFNDDCPLQPEEFWFILANAACDKSNQDLATADAVRTVFEGKKLVVYDAQLYNQFDSIWIKNWKKKPIGQ